MAILNLAYDKTVAAYDRKKFAVQVRVCGDFWGGLEEDVDMCAFALRDNIRKDGEIKIRYLY